MTITWYLTGTTYYVVKTCEFHANYLYSPNDDVKLIRFRLEKQKNVTSTRKRKNCNTNIAIYEKGAQIAFLILHRINQKYSIQSTLNLKFSKL